MNIVGPEKPFKLGAAQSKRILFGNYSMEHRGTIQMTVFQHCDKLRLGINVSNVNANADRIMFLVEDKLDQLCYESY